MKTAIVISSAAGVAVGMPGYDFKPSGGLPPMPVGAVDPASNGNYGAVDPIDTGNYGAVDPVDNGNYGAVDPVDTGYGTNPTGVSPVNNDYNAVSPDYIAPSYGNQVISDKVGPSYGSPSDVSPATSGGDYQDQIPSQVSPATFDDDFVFDDIADLPIPAETTPYNGCDSYDADDWYSCVLPTQAPVCVHETETEVITTTEGPTPSCVYVTDTTVLTSTCSETQTECVTNTSTIEEPCDTITTTVTIPQDTTTICAGTITADPYVITNFSFTYSPTIIHPTTIITSTQTIPPVPETKTSYATESIKITPTITETKYDQTTIKVTPTVVETIYHGVETEEKYETVIPAPVVVDVVKTIWVPQGCVEPTSVADECYAVEPTDVIGGDYGDNNKVISDVVGPSYGAVDPVDTYGAVDPVDTYGAVDPVDTYGAVDPIDTEYGAVDPVDTAYDDVIMPGDYRDASPAALKPSY